MSDLTSKTVEELREMYLSPLGDAGEWDIFDEIARRLEEAQQKIVEQQARIAELLDALSVWEGYISTDLEEVRLIGGNKTLAALQPSTYEAMRAMKEIDKGWPSSQEAWQRQGYRVVNGDDMTTYVYMGTRTDGTKYAAISYKLDGKTINTEYVEGAEGDDLSALAADRTETAAKALEELPAKIERMRDEAYEKVASIADAQQSCYRDDRVIAALRAIAVASRALKSKG